MNHAFRLGPGHEQFRARVRAVVADGIAPFALEVDEQERFPVEAVEALRAAGLYAPHVPTEYGGEGAGAIEMVLLVEEISRVCASTSLVPAINKSGTSVMMTLDDREQMARYLPNLAAGQGGFSYCLSETDAGSDAANQRTRAVLDGDQWVLTGEKAWVTNAGESQFYSVLAVTDPEQRSRGISAFVVDRDDPGVSFGPRVRHLGFRGSPVRTLILDEARIPKDRLVGAPGAGFGAAMKVLDHSRVMIAGQALGIAQGALDHVLRELGPQAGSVSQATEFALARMGMLVTAARQMTYAAAGRSARQSADLAFFGAVAKAFASDVAMSVTSDAVELLGDPAHPVEKLMRDAKLTQIYEGTNQVQAIVMARQLLAGVQSSL